MFKTQCECTSTHVLRATLTKLCRELNRCRDFVVAVSLVDDFNVVVDELCRRGEMSR